MTSAFDADRVLAALDGLDSETATYAEIAERLIERGVPWAQPDAAEIRRVAALMDAEAGGDAA